jgi:hypothetical protein
MLGQGATFTVYLPRGSKNREGQEPPPPGLPCSP